MTSIGKLRIGEKVPARIMGVINVSPESFYKNSVKTKVNEIANVATEMQKTGADMIDVGAMSTAPYLETIISVEQETRRMTHAIEVIKSNCSLPISADTPRAEVAKEAIKLGADAINDISGLKYDKKMADIVARSGLPIIIGAYKNIFKANLYLRFKEIIHWEYIQLGTRRTTNSISSNRINLYFEQRKFNQNA